MIHCFASTVGCTGLPLGCVDGILEHEFHSQPVPNRQRLIRCGWCVSNQSSVFVVRSSRCFCSNFTTFVHPLNRPPDKLTRQVEHVFLNTSVVAIHSGSEADGTAPKVVFRELAAARCSAAGAPINTVDESCLGPEQELSFDEVVVATPVWQHKHSLFSVVP